ncbi:hypothetical protein DSUL_150103 [Desulfovibrionales bacterium]
MTALLCDDIKYFVRLPQTSLLSSFTCLEVILAVLTVAGLALTCFIF